MIESIYSLGDLKEIVKEILTRRKRRVSKGSLSLSGEWIVEHKRGDIWLPTFGGKNIIPTVGLNTFLNITVGSSSKITTWYIAIFKANYTPTASDTLNSTFVGSSGAHECTDSDYTPNTNRPTYSPTDATSGVLTNAASKAEYNIISNITIYGAFLASTQAKAATSGILLAAKKFDTARSVVNGDVLYVTYQITATST